MKKLIILFSIFFLTACHIDLDKADKLNVDDGLVACTMEAKECPDGSYVGRVAPDCSFAPCPEVGENNEKDFLLQEPVDNFLERITKKNFGQYITPANSPIQPERFSGLHTGVDVEFDDVIDDVPVRAIADGKVLRSAWVSGYGGMMVLSHNIEGEDYTVVYGHLDPDSMLEVDRIVLSGEQIAILGEDHSNETDQERKHLHFAIYRGKKINILGYVQNHSDLADWVDPLIFYQN